MTYELTSILITISAASASFVAILGGFIASKLLSINGDRDSIINNIVSLENEIKFLSERTSDLQYQLDEEDAISFIIDNLESLINGDSLDKVYVEQIQNHISKITLVPFWDKAYKLFLEMRDAVSESDCLLNEDTMPAKLATKYVDSNFEYTVLFETCKSINDKIQAKPTVGFLGIQGNIQGTTGLWYSKNNDEIYKNNKKLKELEFKHKQMLKQKNELKKPKGMKQGLVVFALFSVLCILVPLIFVPYQTTNYTCYLIAKISFISIFALGIISIFIYLIYLLRWKEIAQLKIEEGESMNE